MTAAAQQAQDWPAQDLLAAVPAELLDPLTPPRWSPERATFEVFSHADVTYLTEDPDRVFTQSYGDPAAHPFNGFVWASDPPTHGRLRRPISAPFRPRQVQQLQSGIRAAVADLAVDCAGDGTFDLARFARRLSNRVICGLLDVDADVEEAIVDRLLREHAEAMTTAAPPNGEAWRAWAAAQLAAKRARPGRGLIDHLLQVQAAGYPLTDAEIESDITGMVSAGTDTTAAQVATTVLWLDRHGQLAAAAADQQLRRTAAEEVLRLDPAFPAVRVQSTAPVRFGSLAVPAGQPVTGWITAANRDPAVFGADAGEVDLRRSPNPHLSFVTGRHTCLGASLARAEVDAVLELLPRLLPGLAADPADPPRRQLGIVHGIAEARLSYTGTRHGTAVRRDRLGAGR